MRNIDFLKNYQYLQYEIMKSKGLEFYKELTTGAWGTEFAILDPDNNKIEFQQRK